MARVLESLNQERVNHGFLLLEHRNGVVWSWRRVHGFDSLSLSLSSRRFFVFYSLCTPNSQLWGFVTLPLLVGETERERERFLERERRTLLLSQIPTKGKRKREDRLGSDFILYFLWFLYFCILLPLNKKILRWGISSHKTVLDR